MEFFEIFIKKFLDGNNPIIHGDGLQTRDFVYVKDVVNANLQATDSHFTGILNIGTGKETDIRTIYKLIATCLKSNREAIFGPEKPGEQRRSCISSDRAKKELGWKCLYDITRGLTETVMYFQSNLIKSK